jgi:hypothetical protein
MKLIKSKYNGLDARLSNTSKMKPVNRAARRAIASNRQPIKGNKK